MVEATRIIRLEITDVYVAIDSDDFIEKEKKLYKYLQDLYKGSDDVHVSVQTFVNEEAASYEGKA